MHTKLMIAATALAALTSAGLQEAGAQDAAKATAHAGKLFRESCVNCHTVPDTRFETDRAWLSQVYDTA